MSHVLITFLGKGEKGSDDLYTLEKYHFKDDDDDTHYETNFFGLAVLEHLKNKDNPPNKLVILGTPSSMWNALFEVKGEIEDDYEDDWAALADAIQENTKYPEEDEAKEEEKITEHFFTLKTALSKHLGGIECELRVIPYGENQEKQIAILEKMAECVKEKDTVSLDITHGLRHLPMLVVLSAMYLEVVKNVTIAGIYYGAEGIKNRNDGIAPALNLKGLLGIANWVGALNSFDNNGDYSVFADVLKNDGFSQADALKRAAYFERIIDIKKASKTLETTNKLIEEGLTGVGELFSNELQERVSWHKLGRSSDEIRKVYLQQRELAFSYLDKRDYVRAAKFAFEAMITRSLNQGDDPYAHDQRENAKSGIPQSLDKDSKSDYFLLKEIRNQLAHGSYSKEIKEPNKKQKQQTLQEAKDLLKNEDQLRSELKRLMKNLLK